MTTSLLRIALTLPAAFVAVPHRRVATAPAASRCAPAVAKEAPLPRDIKEVINQMRASVQTGMQARLSRMDVDLPYGAEFGVEGGEKRKKGAMLTSEDVARSDRELARLFVEMFDGTGLRPLVLFSDEKQAKRAKRAKSHLCRIIELFYFKTELSKAFLALSSKLNFLFQLLSNFLLH